MPIVPYRKSNIPQPIADRDKENAYLRAELETARAMIGAKDQRIKTLKVGRNILLARNHDLERDNIRLRKDLYYSNEIY
ncbi:hypothetical protein DY124_06315 [Apilactobacillus micheneri]|uniref:hypothetical protein n=1 Tax=Apilactobacillus micheneri TaxID=1899430 RepID=UPI00112AEC0A|nr:hypothetical protein [Apilactobacillus micheneri]TPR43187.1 hypothetical protein DY124_06315 [Apilactobacillus micheneri]